ncbi:MAG TPA: glycosyltransferase family 4 protein [Planctomycetota bacterium]|nr:glycosyltransferase family 4 protein [Planctomycetota bacterium]
MRILHAHDFFAPGNSRFAFDMDRLLQARGHEVHVLAAVAERGPADGAVIEGVTFHTYPHKADLPASRRLAYSNEMNRSKFGEAHARHRFELLLLNQPLCAMGVCDHPAAKGLPKVYWFISPWAAEWKASNPEAHLVSRLFNTSLRNRMESLALQASDAVFVESEFIRRELKAHHRKIPDAKVTLIPGAVDLAKFRPEGTRDENRARFGIRSGPVALTVRRLVERMGIDLLIRAAAEVPGLEVVIGGDGPLRGDLEALAQSLRVPATFLGYVKDEDLPALYRAADLFVLPTRALEGFGLVAIEAMACGTPAMGTPVGAIPEVLGPLRLVFDDVTPQAIAGGIRRFFAERDAGLPERCRAHVAEHYDWSQVIAKAEQVLVEVAREGPGHGRR